MWDESLWTEMLRLEMFQRVDTSYASLAICIGFLKECAWHVAEKCVSVCSVLDLSINPSICIPSIQINYPESSTPSMLVNLMLTWHKLKSFGKRDSKLRKCLHNFCYRHDGCGRTEPLCRPWAGGPGFYKKAGWLSHGDQGSTHMAYASVPASRFLPWASALTFFHDEQ